MKKIKYIFFIILLGFICINSNAQSENITINAESGIDELVKKHILYNEEDNALDGYRLQIFFESGNNSRKNAISERTKFLNTYSNQKAYLVFNSPNYVVRVGNFRSRLEAESFLKEIIEEYPQAYIVKDDIEVVDM